MQATHWSRSSADVSSIRDGVEAVIAGDAVGAVPVDSAAKLLASARSLKGLSVRFAGSVNVGG